MKKTSIVFIILCLLLTACGGGQKEHVNLDNPTYYYSLGRHRVAEAEKGYYTLFNDLLVYVDKEMKKPYLISQEKYSLDQLLKDEEICQTSDAYFKDADVFVEDEKVYLATGFSLVQLDPQNGNRTTLLEHEFSTNPVLSGGNYYRLETIRKEGTDRIETWLKIYNLDDKKEVEALNLSETLKELPNLNIPIMYPSAEGVLLLAESLEEDLTVSQELLYYGPSDKEVVTISPKEGQQLTQAFQYEGDWYVNAVSLEEEESEKETCFHVNLDEKSLEEWKEVPALRILESNGEELVLAPGTGLSYYFTMDVLQEGEEVDYAYPIEFKGQTVNVPEKYMEKRNGCVVVVTSDGNPLLVYENGKIVLIDEEGPHDVF